MQPQRPPPLSDDSEVARAFLQARVTLFWKVMFFITLLGNGLDGEHAEAWWRQHQQELTQDPASNPAHARTIRIDELRGRGDSTGAPII